MANLDSILLLGIVLVFATAMIGAYTRRRVKDRALAQYHGFHVTVELVDGRRIWGRLHVFPNGIELIYSRPFEEAGRPTKTSYIFYEAEFSHIISLSRYHDELTPRNQERRRLALHKATHPGILRRAGRGIRNFFNTFRDAINQSIGMILSRTKGASSPAFLQTQEKQLQKAGEEAVFALGSAFDPILETYIGHRIVAELSRTKAERQEWAGVMLEYSPSWLAVADCKESREFSISLYNVEQLRIQRTLDFRIRLVGSAEGPLLTLEIEEFGTEPIHARRLQSGLDDVEFVYEIDQRLKPGSKISIGPVAVPEGLVGGLAADETLTLDLIAPERGGNADDSPGMKLPKLLFVFAAERELDVAFPRGLAVARHAGEYVGGLGRTRPADPL